MFFCGEYRSRTDDPDVKSGRSSPSSSLSILLLKVHFCTSCGEYRSRTDDLLRARQAL
jgi:hypothetical protein